MAKIFLTGACGNVGRPALSELLKRGYEVTALVHKNSAIEGCRKIRGKISQAVKFEEEITSADAVIHLASSRSMDRKLVVKEDILGTGLLLDRWRKGNFVYMSSTVVYGIPRGPLTEQHPLSLPMYWYDIGKMCGESQLAMEPARHGRGVGVSLRMALLFGPGRGKQFLEDIYAHCVRGGFFAFESEEAMETAGASFVGPCDLARAIADSLELKTAGAYNISSGFCLWRDLIETMCKKSGFTPRLSLLSNLPRGAQYKRLPQSRSSVDTSLFSKLTGFTPKQELDELLDDFIRSQP